MSRAVIGDSTRHYAYGTSITRNYPFGHFVRGAAMCSDGRVRSLKRFGGSHADTFFSVPASVQVRGKTVTGFVTVETAEGNNVPTTDDPAVLKFVAVLYGRNHALLPRGAWLRQEQAS